MARTTTTVKDLKDVAMEGIDWTEELARRRAYSNTINAAAKSLDQFIQYANNSGNFSWVKDAVKLFESKVVPEKARSRQLVQEAYKNGK